MFWCAATADSSKLRAYSGVALVTKASMGTQLDPLIKIGMSAAMRVYKKKNNEWYSYVSFLCLLDVDIWK